MLLKNGISNVNTENPDDIDLAKDELKSLIDAVNIKLSTDDYTNVPEGKAWVHQMWSGSAISAQWYLPEGTGPEALGFWFPQDGKGRHRERHGGRPAKREEPGARAPLPELCARREERLHNFSNYVGYQPPFTKLDPDRLVADGVVPKNLKTAIVRESDFDVAYPLTELTPTGATDWQNAWAEFKAGV